MKLHADEVAARLGLARETVHRWARQGRIPAQRQGSSWVFDRAEIEKWTRENQLREAGESPPRVSSGGMSAETLAAALHRGGIHYEVGGQDMPSVLRSATDLLPLPVKLKEALHHRLVEREELTSTGVGHGVALPHPRQPEPMIGDEPIVMACFTRSPVDFSAIDGVPVSVIFVLLSPNTKIHLQLLSRLAYLVRDDEFRALLEQRAGAAELIEAAAAVDGALGRGST